MEIMADEAGGDWDGGVYSPDRGALPLFTDLYQLRMLQAYFEEGMMEDAVFSLFVRRLPPRRNLLIACGLDTVARCLERIRFTPSDLSYLDSLGEFSGTSWTGLGAFASLETSGQSARALQCLRGSRSWRSPRRCRKRSSSKPSS